ncbi:hypothetical protein ACFX58_14455 [Sphingomonas sp. NCPPB 2930]
MVTPISIVRRERVPVVDIPQDLEPAPPVPVTPSGPRSLAPGDGNLAALRRPPSMAASTATAATAALPSAPPTPGGADSQRLVRTPLPVVRPERQLLVQDEGFQSLGTGATACRRTDIDAQDRTALSAAVETLLAFPYVVFDEMSTIVQRLPLPAADAAAVSAGLALEWLLAGEASSDPEERLRQLGHAGVADDLLFRQELMQGLRRLGGGLPVGSVIRVADRDLALRLNLLMSAEVAVIDAVVREMADMLRNSTRSFHLLLLGGGSLPRPVACIRESDAMFSVFDPSRGVFTAADDELQAVIMGIAAEHEQHLLHRREREDIRDALAILHDAQLMEVTMEGVEIDGDGVHYGGLV